MSCCEGANQEEGGVMRTPCVVTEKELKDTFKVVLLGESGGGKSALAHRFAHDSFVPSHTPTVGTSFFRVTVPIGIPDCSCTLQLWDTAGQERYRSLAGMYLRGAEAVVVVYDVTSRQSFQGASHWLDHAEHFGNELPPFFLVANKIDLLDSNEPAASEEALSRVLSHKSLPVFHKVSALDGTGAEALAAAIAHRANAFVNGPNPLNVKRAAK